MANHKARLELFQEKAQRLGRVDLVGPLALGQARPDPATGALLAVDGGLAHFPRADFSVGDGDSHPRPAQAHLDLRLPAEKDRSDLSHALELIPAPVKEIHLYGVWGGRFDHQMMNQGALHEELLKRQARACVFGPGPERLWAFAAGGHRLNLCGTFSLWSLALAQVRIQGACRYPLERATALAPLSSLTLSNEGEGEVEFTASQPFFVYTEAP